MDILLFDGDNIIIFDIMDILFVKLNEEIMMELLLIMKVLIEVIKIVIIIIVIIIIIFILLLLDLDMK